LHLKRLELFGFKTFADFTELDFDRGITAIVGPNGCGKSNVSDAILWVLGERSLKAVRGSQPQDVIFKGSSQRKPLGLAEVSLTIDNADGALPLDFSEVTITRRLHRSGDSEFLINKQRCRLKDIYELFLDTGVGRSSYSVIGQNQIDSILSIRPEDRRALFEEVAGIRKYRYRKEEALRKLEKTEQNLTRVGDLMYGIEIQLEPLAEQAEQARAYRELNTRARALKLGLLVRDYELLRQRQERIDRTLASLADQIAAAQAALARWEAQEQQSRLELTGCEEEMDERRERLTALAAELERLDGQLAVIRERQANQEERRVVLAQEVAEVQARQTHQAQELARVQREQKELQAAWQARQAALQTHQAAAQQRLAQMQQADAASAAQRERLVRLAGEMAARENQIQNLEVQAREAARRAEAVRAQGAQLEQTRSAAEAQVNALAGHLEQARKDLADVQQQVREHQARLRDQEEVQGQLRDRMAEVREALSDRRSRLRALEEMVAHYEGFYRGVRTVLRGRDSGALKGSYEVVADVIRVPPEGETALEAALGGSLQNLITASGEQAQQAIQYLKDRRGGRATFLPLDLVQGERIPEPLEAIRGQAGVVGLGLDLVDYDPRYEPIMQHLLARVVVVESLDVGLRIRARTGQAGKIVTLDGDLIYAHGAMSGGSEEAQRPALLSRKREISELQEALPKLQQDLTHWSAQDQQLEQELHRQQEALERSQQAAAEQREYVGDRERKWLAAQNHLERLEADLRRLREEEKQLQNQQAQAQTTMSQLRIELEQRRADRAQLEESLSASESRLRAERQRTEELAAQITAQQVELAQLDSARRTLAETERRLLQAQEAAAREWQRLAEEQATLQRQQQQTAQTAAAYQEKLQTLLAQRTEEEQALAAQRAGREDLLAQISHTLHEMRAQREEIQRLQQEVHKQELRRTQVESELRYLQQELVEDYQGLSLAEAQQQAIDIPNRNDALQELKDLQTAMRDLGDVNLGAIEEYQRLTERLEFLREQRRDLEGARAKLQQIIAEIDDTTKEQFITTFKAVSVEFQDLFRRLFGGGKTELVLTEPGDLLNTGIEVLVQLPGKRQQNLLLLSGGERALTAIALVFAMFRVKPSPFCVLDELDASLDDTNVVKFSELLTEFAAQSQFIVITHNKATMEASDVLYGITMAEPGVSTRCSYRFTDGDGHRNPGVRG